MIKYYTISMSFFLKTIIVLNLFLCSSILSAQTPINITLGADELYNIDVYSLLYDDNTDYLYIGTNDGMYVYKQNTIVRIPEAQGQLKRSYFNLKQNSNGEIFCSNLSGEIFLIDNNRLNLYYKPPKGETIGPDFWYFFDERDDLYMISTFKIKKRNKNGEVRVLFSDVSRIASVQEVLPEPKLSLNSNPNRSESRLKSILFVYSRNKLGVIQNNSIRYLDKEFAPENESRFVSIYKHTVFGIDVNGALSDVKNRFYQNFESVHKERILAIDSSKMLALHPNFGYRYLFFKNDTLNASKKFFENIFISAQFINEDGTLFLGTFGEGILVIPKEEIQKYSSNQTYLGMAVSEDNELALSTQTGEVLMVNQKKTKKIFSSQFNIDNVFYMPHQRVFETYGKNQFCFNNPYNILASVKDVKIINDSSVLVSSRSGVIFYPSKNFSKPLPALVSGHENNKLLVIDRCHEVEWSPKDSLIYYANMYGVFSREWSSLKTDSILFNDKSFLANDLLINKNTLYCATNNNGVLSYKKGVFARAINVEDGLFSNLIKQIDIKGELLFILSDKGFQVYHLKLNRFIPLGFEEGVITDEVIKFSLSKDKVWFLEKHAYFSIDIATIREKNPSVARLYMDSIFVNGELINPNVNNYFNHTQNQFEFNYDYRHIVSKNEIEISYILEGFQKDWKTTSAFQNKISFDYLPSGKYTFKIKAIYRGKETVPYSYSFEIKPPYWQRAWFYLLLLLAFLTFATSLYAYLIKKNKRKSLDLLEKQKLKTAVTESKLKALQSQMNPHFIFNALNSVQDLVILKDIRNSNKYLGKFSDLIRKILISSKNQFISLAEEIKILNLYLDLEKLRFGDDFKIDIQCEIDEEKQEEIVLPAMFIQPYIENAIKHGLFHKEGLKKLKVHFCLKEKYLECIVEDNGIGQEKAAELKQKRLHLHTGFSTESIYERIGLLNETLDKKIKLEIIDLEENGKALGTRVVLQFPV